MYTMSSFTARDWKGMAKQLYDNTGGAVKWNQIELLSNMSYFRFTRKSGNKNQTFDPNLSTKATTVGCF